MNPRNRAAASRKLDAVLLLDKPSGISSNAALQQAKRLLKAAKAGHAGTLDPLASGLLPILLGEATKFAGHLLEADKEYLAQIQLGITTTTGDLEGEVLARHEVAVDAASIERALAGLRGEIEQVPPMYSALKRDGTPLYALARQGRSVERAPRRVRIERLELLGRRGDRLELDIRCSKGTYIRSLAEDIGRALGCGACVAALRRTASAGFTLAQAVTLEALGSASEAEREARLLGIDSLLGALPRVQLGSAAAARFRHGQAVALEGALTGRCRVYGNEGRLLGIGSVTDLGELRPIRLVALDSAQPAEIARKTL